MNWRATALSACMIAIAVLLWAFSPYLLDRIGLEDFDPLDRICLVFVVLSVMQAFSARFWPER